MSGKVVMEMGVLRILAVGIMVLVLASPTFAMRHQPEERGKTLFNDPAFAGGKKPCGSCHPAGKGLSEAGGKKRFRIMGKTQNSLEEAVNFCIVRASKGTAIKEDSNEMKDIVAYIKSLGMKESPGYGEPEDGAPGYR